MYVCVHVCACDLMPKGDYQNQTEGLENKCEINLNKVVF